MQKRVAKCPTENFTVKSQTNCGSKQKITGMIATSNTTTSAVKRLAGLAKQVVIDLWSPTYTTEAF